MLDRFEKKTGFEFNDKKILERAFIHRSFLNEKKGENLKHNERLEFLGDAVLELATTIFLYNKFPHKPEGELTALRSALVNTEALSKKAQELEMGKYLRMSKGERKCLKGREHILANTFESFVGALFLDQGFSKVEEFLKKYLFEYIEEILEKGLFRDAKSFFQEMSQEKEKITPQYKLIKQVGPDHDRKFVMGVYLNDEFVAQGEGSSKQKAETEAAKKGLEVKK